jgi:Putative citrate transport
MRVVGKAICVALLGCAPQWALAAELSGSQLAAAWGIPFAGLLLSIALMPLLAPSFWHHHFGKVTAAWTLAFLLPFAATFGPGLAASGVLHALLAEYIPFIVLLTALYTVSGESIFAVICMVRQGSIRLSWPLVPCWPVLWVPPGPLCCSFARSFALTTTGSIKRMWWYFLSSLCPTQVARSRHWATRLCFWAF